FQVINLGFGRSSAAPSEGIAFENFGNNRIVNSKRHPDSQRSFHFDYSEQAKQNLSLEVYDAPNSSVSHTMHSLFWFFPRRNMFIAQEVGDSTHMTIPTGEKV